MSTEDLNDISQESLLWVEMRSFDRPFAALQRGMAKVIRVTANG